MIKILLYIALVLLAPFYIWGWVFETAYFRTLEIKLPDNMNIYHYLVSGLAPFFYIFAILLVLKSLAILFSKSVLEGKDGTKFSTLLAEGRWIGEKSATDMARFGILVGPLYFLLVFYDFDFWGLSKGLGFLFWYVILTVIGLVFWKIIISTPRNRFVVLVSLTVSLAFVYAAGGMWQSRFVGRSDGVLRDDFVIRIVRKKGEVSITLKNPEQFLPLKLLKNALGI